MARKSITETKRDMTRISQSLLMLKQKVQSLKNQIARDKVAGVYNPRDLIAYKSAKAQMSMGEKRFQELKDSIPTLHCNEYILIVYYLKGGERYKTTYVGLRNRDEIQSVVERDIEKFGVLLDDFQHVTTGTLEKIKKEPE